MKKDLRRMIQDKKINKPKYNYKLGCFMTVYSRPDLLIDSVTSILHCHNLTGIKFVIVDDCSPMDKIGRVLEGFITALKARGNDVTFIRHERNYGKAEYDKTLKECFEGLSDCEYVCPLPPDFVFNPYLFDVARECFRFIVDKVKAITFSIDSRFDWQGLNHNKTENEYFSFTRMIDWGPGVFSQGFIQEFLPGVKSINAREGTGTAHTIYNTAMEKGYFLWQYIESLCQHIGNSQSAMNPEYRAELPLTNCRVNLMDRPAILQGNIHAEYIPRVDNFIENSSNLDGVKKILIIKSCGVGNIVAITPTIIKLKQIYPESIIDLLVQNKAIADILKGWELLNDIYIEGEQSKTPRYDIIINGLPALISTSGLRGIIYTGQVDWYKQYMHEVQANIKILKQIHIDKDIIKIPDQFIPEPETKHKLDKIYTGKYIGISAGFYTGMDFKNWGYDKFAELILKLLNNFSGYKVLVFGAGNDNKIFDYLEDNVNIINCVDKYTIQETACLIGKCAFMVANDTGLAHVSACVKTKCYTIFGPTPARKALPWRYGIEISLNLYCAENCYYDKRWADCKKEIECLKDLSVDYVFERIIEKEKYELGIMMACYNRYEFLAGTLNSVLNTFNDNTVKICIIDDGSTDKRINSLLLSFKNEFKGCLVILYNKTNKGRIGYPYTLRRAFNQLYDCKYVLTIPDDVVINRYSYKAIKKSYRYFNTDTKCINFFRDKRFIEPCNDRDKEFFFRSGYDKFFDVSNGIDGFMCLFENKFLKNMDWCIPSSFGKTNFWYYFHIQLKQYKNLLYKETLCLHVGNMRSIMWGNDIETGKRKINIEGSELNLFNEPFIVSGNVFEYSAEWYSNQYHAKGAYNLPGRKFNELQEEWEGYGYKKRFYAVLDECQMYINFEEINTICEVGCHHGKSVFWMSERYPHIKYEAFDFSPVAIKWCKENNPYKNINFKLGDVRAMPYKKKFDIVTCMDVAEHLPEDIYFEMIKELKRISGKYIIWYVGRTVLPEHINLRSIEQQKKDLKDIGDIIELCQYYLLVKVK